MNRFLPLSVPLLLAACANSSGPIQGASYQDLSSNYQQLGACIAQQARNEPHPGYAVAVNQLVGPPSVRVALQATAGPALAWEVRLSPTETMGRSHVAIHTWGEEGADWLQTVLLYCHVPTVTS